MSQRGDLEAVQKFNELSVPLGFIISFAKDAINLYNSQATKNNNK